MVQSKTKLVLDSVRNPLSPLDTTNQRQWSLRMDNASDVSDLQDVSLFNFGESEFDLMHVKVTVHALSGLLSDRVSLKKKAMSALTGSKKSKPSVPKGSSSSSSLTSASDGSYVAQHKTPTLAVATFRRNVSSSQTAIKTHFPSSPLGMPTSSFGKVNRYMAKWQEPKPELLREEGEVDDQSSFTFLRVMMREPMDYGNTRTGTNASRYVHENLEIEINLSRGKEIIPLGVASLAITGDEEGPTHMILPAKSVVLKGKKTVVREEGGVVTKGKRLFRKKVKHASFPSDPKRTYYLDENATLRVTVLLTPQDVINDVKARERAKDIRRQMKIAKSKDENSIVCDDQAPSRNLRSQKRPAVTDSSAGPQTSEISFMGKNFFCGACPAMGGEAKDETSAATSIERQSTKDYSVESSTFEQMVQEKYGYSLASSVLSSVSESDSSSEEESVDPNIHLNRKIVIRKTSKEIK